MNKTNFALLVMAIFFTLSIFPIGVKAAFVSIPNGSFETGDFTDFNAIQYSFDFQGGGTLAVTSNNLLAKLNSFGGINATDGNFFSAMINGEGGVWWAWFQTIDSTSAILKVGKTYDICFDDQITGIGGIFSVAAIRKPNYYLDYNGGAFKWGNVYGQSKTEGVDFDKLYETNSANGMQTKCIYNYKNNNAFDAYLGFGFAGGGISGAIKAGIDNIRIQEHGTLSNSINTSAQPASLLTPFNIFVQVKDQLGQIVTDANVKLQFNLDGNVLLGYDPSLQEYVYSNSGTGQGNFNYTVYSERSSYATAVSSGVFVVQANPKSLTVTGIANCSPSVSVSGINLNIGGQDSDAVFRVQNPNSFSINTNTFWYNPDKSGNQYFIYTSTNRIDWVFNDTLTFGSNNYNPIQKIWDVNKRMYKYSFVNNFLPGDDTYYKISYSKIPVSWEFIGGSNDWANTNPPSKLTDNIDFGGLHNWDLFQDSNLTPVNSYTIKPYPQLTSPTLTTGFELQFTAYAASPTTLKVGYRVDYNDTTQDISITTQPTRISILIAPNSNNALLLIKTLGSVSDRVYLSDYAVIPRSYFLDRLDLRQSDGEKLQAVVYGGVSQLYMQETIPYKDLTKAYNFDGSLSLMRTEIIEGGTTLKTFETNLNLTSGDTTSFNLPLDGVIDYNGQSWVNDNLQTPRYIRVKNTLIDNQNNSVAEQSQTLLFLQYPYFPSDLQLNTMPVLNKVGENPKFDVTIKSVYPDALIGLKFYIFDVNGSATNPNYSEIIYKNDLGCDTFVTCSKEITISQYAFPEPGTYTLGFGAILTTEPQNFDNFLTKSEKVIQSNYAVLTTARVLQVFERSDNNYTNTEPIPLVLQVSDDELRNLKDFYNVYMVVDETKDGGATWDSVGHFSPVKYVYDDATGYNYWFWNSLFYNSSGQLLDHNTKLRFKAYMQPVKTGVTPVAYGLTNKCVAKPTDVNLFSPASFLYNWNAIALDTIYGCQLAAPNVVSWDSPSAYNIIIDTNRHPNAIQNESVFCIRQDSNRTFKQDLGDSFICGVMYRKSEANIDGFRVYLGNAFSDYSKTGATAQYITFDIPSEEVMFNDILMLRASLETDYQTNQIHTLGQVLAAGFNKLLPYGQGFVDAADLAVGNNLFNLNAGADVNLSEQLNPNAVSGIFFFKVDGLKVVNQNDYLVDNPALDTLNPSDFRTYAQAKNLYLPTDTTLITIYSRNFDSQQKIKVNSPLVIDEKSTNAGVSTNDGNTTLSVIPVLLKFNFIVDMFSNNRTAAQRALVPITFTYEVPPAKWGWGSLMAFLNGLMNDPLGTLGGALWDNALILAALLAVLLIVSVVYMNFKGGGGNTHLNFFGRAG